MKIKTMSRQEAEKYIPTKKCIFISITTPHSLPAQIKRNELVEGIFRVSFNDVDKQDETDAIKFIMFDDDMAKAIIDFVVRYKDAVEEIIVHCEAGQSRSVGCAGAIARCFYGDDKEFFENKTPNMLVYRTILKVFHKEKSI